MTAPSSPRRLWWLLVVCAACYFLSFAFWPGLFLVVGVNHYGVWFLDSFAILASNDAITRGLDPYAVNPLDYFNRPHVYSQWWLRLRDLGLTRADNFWIGWTLVSAFFVAAVARLRPRAPGELVLYLAVLCSSPVLLAINRANNDLVIFIVLAPLVPCLLAQQRAVRLLGVFLVAIATGLKFYPAVAGLVLLAGADTRELRWRVSVAVLALIVVAIGLRRDLAGFSAIAPKAEGLMTFGAADIFESFGLAGRMAKYAGLAVGAAIAAAFLRAKFFEGWEIRDDQRDEWWSFALGATLLVGCFFAGTNFAYRWIFAIWLAPLLWRLPRDPAAPLKVRRLARVVVVLLLIGLWADPLASALLTRFTGKIPGELISQWADRFFLLEQPLIWALFGCLLGFVVHFARGGVRTLFARATPVSPPPSAQ